MRWRRSEVVAFGVASASAPGVGVGCDSPRAVRASAGSARARFRTRAGMHSSHEGRKNARKSVRTMVTKKTTVARRRVL